MTGVRRSLGSLHTGLPRAAIRGARWTTACSAPVGRGRREAIGPDGVILQLGIGFAARAVTEAAVPNRNLDMSAKRSIAVRPRPTRFCCIAAAAMLLAVLPGCSAVRDFPQNVRALNDGFGSPQLDHQTRTVEADAYRAMPGFGEIVLTLPRGAAMGTHTHGGPPVSLSYDKNRAAGLMGSQWRKLGVRGVEPDADGVLRLPVPHITGYHPTSLLVWVRAPDADGARSMRLDFPLTEPSVIDPNDPDRHAAFWMDHRGACLARGRIQPIEYADDTQATIGGARHPFEFDTTLSGLCVFPVPPQTAIIATDTPGTPLRSPVRVRIPKVYLHSQFSGYWQPPVPPATENE